MKKNLSIFIFALLTPLLALAHDVPVYTDANRPIMQGADQSEFVIQLNANPSTGYAWFLKSYDPNYIKVIQHQYIQPKRTLPGAGGIEEWKFQLTPMALAAPHRFSIEFVYARAWESNASLKPTVFHIVTR